MRTIALLGSLFLASIANAVVLYTAPVNAPYGQEVACEFVNVNGTTFVSTIYIIDGDAGNVVTSYTCSTAPTQPGCSITYYTVITDSGFYFCKFDIAPSTKTAIRGHGGSCKPFNKGFWTSKAT